MPTSWSPNSSAGFTLVEMLVVLTVLGLAAALLARGIGGAPGSLGQQRELAGLKKDLASARAAAVRSGAPVALEVGDNLDSASFSSMLPGRSADLVFYPDGSSNGGTVKLGGQAVLTVDWLTGEARDAR